MTDKPISPDRYIQLTTKDEMDNEVVRSWLLSVKENAPSGVLSTIQTTDDKGYPRCVSLIHRECKSGHNYLIPLTRDLSETEIQKIVDNFATKHLDNDFDISTNQTVLKSEEKKALTLDQEQHLSLCMAMAKEKHEDWVRERSNAGWRYGTMFNIKERTHPLLLPWDQLPDRYKTPDLSWPQKLVQMLNSQGYAVIRSDELTKLMTMLRGIV